MMMILTWLLRTSRRALERNSKMESDGVSSIQSGARSSAATPALSWFHSAWVIFLLPLILSGVMPVSETITRLMSCVELISSENIATGILWSTAMLRAMVSTKAVLPTDGRAARMMRSERCQPKVTSSIPR